VQNRYATLAAWVYELDKPVGRSFGDVEFYLERLQGVTGPVLEPAVGNGRLFVPLLEAGLVRRHRSPTDGRALSLYVTKAGRAVTDRVEEETSAHEADLLRALSATERQTLIALLDRAIGGAEEAVQDLVARQTAEERTGTEDE